MGVEEMRSGFFHRNPLTGRHVLPGGAEDDLGNELGNGGVAGSVDHTWEGDGSNDRPIDLGDDYDLIFIFLEEPAVAAANHPAMAYAFREAYGHFYEDSLSKAIHLAMSSADPYWQGKMTGGDATKVKLGSGGGSTIGVNAVGKTYRLVGIKFDSMA
ncbi:MAG: hypothetical protein ACYTAN_10310 [Planctomycetota bacterium]|jgi:hypothetical protein